MRIIEQEMLEAIRLRRNWRKSNTQVIMECGGAVTTVYLHGNLIAVMHINGGLWLSSQSWRTRTTKSRLNAILEQHNMWIYQRNGLWYFDCGMPFSDAPVQSILNDFRSQHEQTRDKNLFVA